MARLLAAVPSLVRSRLIPAAALAALVGAIVAIASAETIDPLNDDSQYAWGENVGWINAEPMGEAGPGLIVSGTKLTGWMYSENIGWINMHCENNVACASAAFGVTNDGAGNLAGYAWAANAGWISFSCANTGTCGTTEYGVMIDPATGIFSGDAWGENIGWITFSDASPVAYSVRTDDADGIAGIGDNCPFDANADQTNTDGGNFSLDRAGSDGRGDVCDEDDDGDGYTDMAELSITEDALAYCALMRADIDEDGTVTIVDIGTIGGFFLQTVPPASERYDQDSDPTITISDVGTAAGLFLQTVDACP